MDCNLLQGRGLRGDSKFGGSRNPQLDLPAKTNENSQQGQFTSAYFWGPVTVGVRLR